MSKELLELKPQLQKLVEEAKAFVKANPTISRTVYLTKVGTLIDDDREFGTEEVPPLSPSWVVCWFNETAPEGGTLEGDRNFEDALESAIEQRRYFYTEREKQFGASAWPSPVA
jgi:hypothetical protein